MQKRDLHNGGSCATSSAIINTSWEAQFTVFSVHNRGIMCVRVQHKHAHKPTANDSVQAMQIEPVQAVHNAVDQR